MPSTPPGASPADIHRWRYEGCGGRCPIEKWTSAKHWPAKNHVTFSTDGDPARLTLHPGTVSALSAVVRQRTGAGLSVDAMADAQTARLPRFVSYHHDPRSMHVDFFGLPRSSPLLTADDRLLCFPPPGLVGAAVAKLRTLMAAGVLVAFADEAARYPELRAAAAAAAAATQGQQSASCSAAVGPWLPLADGDLWWPLANGSWAPAPGELLHRGKSEVVAIPFFFAAGGFDEVVWPKPVVGGREEEEGVAAPPAGRAA